MQSHNHMIKQIKRPFLMIKDTKSNYLTFISGIPHYQHVGQGVFGISGVWTERAISCIWQKYKVIKLQFIYSIFYDFCRKITADFKYPDRSFWIGVFNIPSF